MKNNPHETCARDPAACRSLKASFWDGTFASAMNGFTQDYFAPFLLLLGGSPRLVGILNSLQNLSSSVIQLRSADLTVRLKSRRRLINTFVFLQAFVLLPMAALALSCAAPPGAFIAAVVFFTGCGALATPAWSSLMSDLVLTEKRGVYFGWRSKALGLVAVAASLIAGLILQRMKGINACYGFAVIFGGAFIFRLLSWYFLTRMHEPVLNYSKDDQFTVVMFWRRLKESNFAKFVLFTALMNFSVNLASPFFAVLMLKDWSFSYGLYAVLTVTASLTVCLAMSRWGRHADRVGNLKVMRLAAAMIAVVPLLWIVDNRPPFLFLAQLFSGFAWAGFNLATANFIYDAVMPEKRTRCIAYFNAFNGLALCCGSFLGGMVLRYMPSLFGVKTLTLLFVSSVLRLAVAVAVPWRLREVREVAGVSYRRLFFSVVGLKPLA